MGYLNKQGNWTVYNLWMMRERYYYDQLPGYEPYATDQDAPYFGIWIDRKNMVITTFAEGDETVVHCLNEHQFQRELHAMTDFYFRRELAKEC